MKRLYCLIIMVLVSFSFINVVKAEADYSYRADRTNPVIKVNDVDLYVTASLLFNMDGAFSDVRLPVKNITAKFENDSLYVTLKRSEINKVLKENKYDNVYSLLEINADYLDGNSDNLYYFMQLSPDDPYYSYTKCEYDFYYSRYNFIEVYSTSFPLVGLSSEYQKTIGGGYLLYDGVDNNFSDDVKLLKEEIITTDTKIIDISSKVAYVSIIEDEQIDLGENTTIIDSSGRVDEETGEVVLDEVVDIDNFYGEYFENNKLKYSWTMFDENGEPIEIDINTSIRIDESDNEEVILSNFSDEFSNLKDRVKIISFEHEGDLGGTAKISLYVGDKFEAGETLTLYYFNPMTNELENIDRELNSEEILEMHDEYNVIVDKDGYVTIELTHCSEYVLVKEEVKPIEKDDTIVDNAEKFDNGIEKKSNYTPIIVVISMLLIIVVVIIIVILKNRKDKINNKNI